MSVAAGVGAHLERAGGKGCYRLTWGGVWEVTPAPQLQEGTAHACRSSGDCSPPYHGYIGLLGFPLLPCILFSLGYLSSRG